MIRHIVRTANKFDEWEKQSAISSWRRNGEFSKYYKSFHLDNHFGCIQSKITNFDTNGQWNAALYARIINEIFIQQTTIPLRLVDWFSTEAHYLLIVSVTKSIDTEISTNQNQINKFR